MLLVCVCEYVGVREIMIACVRETRDEGNVRVIQERLVVCVRDRV